MVTLKSMLKNMAKKLLNVRSNPNKKVQKIEFQVKMENEKQLRERIAKLEKKLNSKEDLKKNPYSILIQ